MLTQGKSYLVFNHFNSIEKVRKDLDGITSSQIMDVANRIFAPGHLNELIFKK